jgi:hypothetical protein
MQIILNLKILLTRHRLYSYYTHGKDKNLNHKYIKMCTIIININEIILAMKKLCNK